MRCADDLGDTAAEKIIAAREEYDLYSVEELRLRTGISKSVIEILRRNGVLEGLSETDQYSLFDLPMMGDKK